MYTLQNLHILFTHLAIIKLVNTIKLTTSQLAMASMKSNNKRMWSATNPARNLCLTATIIAILFT